MRTIDVNSVLLRAGTSHRDLTDLFFRFSQAKFETKGILRVALESTFLLGVMRAEGRRADSCSAMLLTGIIKHTHR